ncbi:hypothetical protein F444_07258 [Phytophthora nicotianae P1976]|uniref:RxLR effector protein n=1 Tax=Phytophthora nicotianae P1976 TaxID=1317066 RepID=A0A081AF86_PHYNI|nr:hypothetical protein F444_07258 [Phytophthora nicotianae P1976]
MDSTRLLRASVKTDDERAIVGLDQLISPIKSGASKVAQGAEATRLNVWLLKRKTAVGAFTKLKLDQGVDKALSSPNLKTLSNYVDMLKKKYPDNQVSVVETLTAKYGEAAVAKSLVTTKRATNSKDIAAKLQAEQLLGWLNSEKSVKDVFMLLKIADDGVLFAISRKMETLDEYINLFNTKNPQPQTNLFRALRDGSGEDKFVVVVAKAMTLPKTAVAARGFQKTLFKRWINQDYDPASIYVKVFKVPENNMGSVTSEMKLVNRLYREVYYRAKKIDVTTVVDPRHV